MKLFYAPGACSLGIHVLLEEIGKPYDPVALNLREGAQFKPEFTEVNPNFDTDNRTAKLVAIAMHKFICSVK